MKENVERWARAHWRDNPVQFATDVFGATPWQAKFLAEFMTQTPERQAQIIRATSRARVGDYYADPDVGPAVIPSA